MFTYTNEVKASHSIEVIYFAHFVNKLSDITLEAEDHFESGWFAEDELSNATTETKGQDDDLESQAMQKGFALLKGQPLQF